LNGGKKGGAQHQGGKRDISIKKGDIVMHAALGLVS